MGDAGYQGGEGREAKNLGVQIVRAQARPDQGVAGWTPQRRSEKIEKTQGERAREGRASVPRGEAAVGPCDGAIPRAGQEHGASHHVVRVVQSVDGTTAVVGDDGEVACSRSEKARSRSETGSRDPKTALQTPTSPARAGEQTTNRPLTSLINGMDVILPLVGSALVNFFTERRNAIPRLICTTLIVKA